MYAIIQTGSKQYWVTPGDTIRVERLDIAEGKEVEMKALWSASVTDVSEKTDSSKLPQAKVIAKVVCHLRGTKVIVFKRRPKKAYEKTRGHRQDLTEIQIKDIQLSTN
jgi:large subunit ribosomal protein L21